MRSRLRERTAIGAAVLLAGAVPATAFAAEPGARDGDTTADAPPSDEASKKGSIVVWPTLTPAGDDPAGSALHTPSAGEGAVYTRALDLDATLRDAVQDLGFTVDVTAPPPSAGRTRDLDIIERAAHSGNHESAEDDPGTWVVSARLESLGGDDFLLRIVAAPPKRKQLRVRVDRVSGSDVSVRGLVMLRDLLSAPGHESDSGPKPQASAGAGIMAPPHSPGRAVLAANAALFGAFTAFSIQRASGSDDPRLLYPLLALGTGVGLGAALLVAEEWDVGTGAAWMLAGGAWWGAGAGILIANGRHVQPLTDRYAWGVGGGLAGIALTTLALTRSRADDGDAVLLHSGAALGLSLGSLAEFYYVGNIDDRTPYTGAGYGSAIGLLASGTLATFLTVSPSRVLLIDLGAGLGAAAGAALGSPLVFENLTETKTRGFVAATAAGTLLGGGVAWWLTRAKPKPVKSRAGDLHLTPTGGVIGQSATREGNVPAYGVGLHGVW